MEIFKVEALEGREAKHWKGGRSSIGREGGALEGREEQHWKGGAVLEVGSVCLEGKGEFGGWIKMYESKRKNSKMCSKPEATKGLF